MVKKKVTISVLSLLITLPGVTMASTGTPITNTAPAAQLVVDVTGPDVKSFTLAPGQVNVGDNITISAKVTDPSGVGQVVAYLINGTAQRTVTMTYDSTTDTWNGTYTVATNDANGTWALEFDAYDKVGNMSYTSTTGTIQVVNPNGDSTAPVIGAVNLTPQSIQAGAPFTINANVTDNIGVDTVSAVLYSPSGFYVDSIPLTYDSKSGQWGGTYTLSQYAEAGDWRVEIDATDLSGNFSFDDTHTFKLDNPKADTAAPVIGNVTATPSPLKTGDTLAVNANVSDTGSGVSNAIATLWGPSGEAYSYDLALDPTSNLWKSDIVIPDTFAPGDWQLDITAYDVAGNYNTSSAAQTVTVQSGVAKDVTAPVVDNIELSAAQVNTAQALTISVTAHDDLSGINTIQGFLTSPSGAFRYVDFVYDATANKWVGTYTAAQNDEPGQWTLSDLDLTDKAGNTNYQTTTNTFTIVNQNPDFIAPTVDSATISAPTGRVGDQMNVKVKAHDDNSGISMVYADFTDAKGNLVKSTQLTYDQTLDEWDGSFTVDATDPTGPWAMNVYVEDKAGNNNSVATNVTFAVDTTPVISPAYGDANYYFDNGNYYNAVYYAGEAIKQGDQRPEVQTLMNDAAKALLAAAATMNNTDALYAYQLLSTTAGVPTDIKAAADAILTPAGSSPKYADAQWYNDQKNYYNAVYFAGDALADGDTRAQSLLTSASTALLAATATMSITDAQNAYQLLVDTTGVPADTKATAQAELTAIGKYAEAQWYNDQKNYYNAVYFAGVAATGDSHKEVQDLLTSASTALLAATATMNITDAQNAYQLLVDTKGVPADTKATAQAELAAIGKYAEAQWYNDQKNYYNAVYFAGVAVAGDQHQEIQTLLNGASQALIDAVATMSTADAANAYQLLVDTAGVPKTIKDAATAKLVK